MASTTAPATPSAETSALLKRTLDVSSSALDLLEKFGKKRRLRTADCELTPAERSFLAPVLSGVAAENVQIRDFLVHSSLVGDDEGNGGDRKLTRVFVNTFQRRSKITRADIANDAFNDAQKTSLYAVYDELARSNDSIQFETLIVATTIAALRAAGVSGTLPKPADLLKDLGFEETSEEDEKAADEKATKSADKKAAAKDKKAAKGKKKSSKDSDDDSDD